MPTSGLSVNHSLQPVLSIPNLTELLNQHQVRAHAQKVAGSKTYVGSVADSMHLQRMPCELLETMHRLSVGRPLLYNYLSVEPDIIRMAWEMRDDFVILGLGSCFEHKEVAQQCVNWIRDLIDFSLTCREGHVLPEIVERISVDVCESNSAGSRRCGNCLNCNFVITGPDAFILEHWLSYFSDVVPVSAGKTVNDCFLKSSEIILWGPLTFIWTSAAMQSVVALAVPDEPGKAEFLDRYTEDELEQYWRYLMRWLTLKSPLAAIQALADDAAPDTVTITKRDFLPFLQHSDINVRQAAISALGARYGDS